MLNPDDLKKELLDFFGRAPSSFEDCGHEWATAVGIYAAAITPPSTTVTAAAAVLGSSLGAAFALPLATDAMEAGFAAFAATVGSGMTGYVPTPPPGPVGFANSFAQPVPQTHEAAAERMAILIHAWLTTGIATLAVPPGTVVPWS
jgi:hypothetical protein